MNFSIIIFIHVKHLTNHNTILEIYVLRLIKSKEMIFYDNKGRKNFWFWVSSWKVNKEVIIISTLNSVKKKKKNRHLEYTKGRRYTNLPSWLPLSWKRIMEPKDEVGPTGTLEHPESYTGVGTST